MDKKTGMIDVGDKTKTKRIAKAKAYIELNVDIVKRIKAKAMPKGDVLETARIAGILAAKKTPQLVPLCHPIEVESVNLDFILEEKGIVVEAVAKATAKTGVEMEAITACVISAVTIYDMCKMFSKAIQISNIELLEKSGGKSGDYKKGVEL